LQGVQEDAIPTLPIPMVLQTALPIQMKALPVPIILLAPLVFPLLVLP
jgi:hypothetical protein